jgi:hypothetical protein
MDDLTMASRAQRKERREHRRLPNELGKVRGPISEDAGQNAEKRTITL